MDPTQVDIAALAADKIMELGPWGVIMVWSVMTVRKALLGIVSKWDETLTTIRTFSESIKEVTSSLRNHEEKEKERVRERDRDDREDRDRRDRDRPGGGRQRTGSHNLPPRQ